MNCISRIEIDDTGLAAPTPEIEQERKVAVFDLLEENSFAPVPRGDHQPPEGPYALTLSIRDKRLVVDVVTDKTGEKAGEFHLSLGPFRQVVKDYFQICESYFDAVKRLPPSRIEAIDMGRRALHNDAAEILVKALEEKFSIDLETARRLFTLVCALHVRG